VAKTRNKKQGMSGLEIRIALMRKGIKLVEIAARAGVKPPAVTKMLDGNDIYVGRRIRPYIAEALDIPQEIIWPPEEQQKLAQ
jgi:lambda repressor-like predicted transcriptional regulator